MCALEALGYMTKPAKLFKTDSSAALLKFKGCCPVWIELLDKQCPHSTLFKINFCEDGVFEDVGSQQRKELSIPDYYEQDTWEIWLTWYNEKICLGELYEPPFFEYSTKTLDRSMNRKQVIGFIRCKTVDPEHPSIEFDVLGSSDMCMPMELKPPKKIDNGELRWVRMVMGDELPIDAFIGGFEDEPVYIARAEHRGSLCPGKYLKSRQCAFIPWGHEEHSKNEFEVLCGYDAMWIKCLYDKIPENAFVAGRSEIRDEPLFIGRVWIDNNLVPGKVHQLYSTCFIPYEGAEVANPRYEILVTSQTTHGQYFRPPCYMQMSIHPCYPTVLSLTTENQHRIPLQDDLWR